MIPETIIAIDGMPGAGKTTYAEEMRRAYIARGMAASVVSMDTFVLPRMERNGRCVTEWNSGAVVEEVIDASMHSGGCVCGEMYNSQTGKNNVRQSLTIPALSEGVLIVEGVNAAETVLRVATRARVGSIHLAIFVIATPGEIAVQRRCARDAMKKGLSEEFALQRGLQQLRAMNDYVYDLCALRMPWRESTHSIIR